MRLGYEKIKSFIEIQNRLLNRKGKKNEVFPYGGLAFRKVSAGCLYDGGSAACFGAVRFCN